MEYIAHTRNGENQTLKNHLLGTAQLTSKFADKFGKSDWGYCCGLLHDIGKYSDDFQSKIRGANKKVDHSTAGMKLCLEKNGLYSFLSYCIAGHHTGLPDYGSCNNCSKDPTIKGRNEKKICDYQSYKNEIEIPELKTNPIDLDNTNNPYYTLSVFIRMLYSCLVDADYLDTESFMTNGYVERNPGENIESLLDNLEKYVSKWLDNSDVDTVNGRRTEILKNCFKEGESNKGMFKLTVPTGGGKTLSSLAFALKHAKENNMDRVIYVIPYTSIIEQNAEVFRSIFGRKNVLENHCNVEYEDDVDDIKGLKLAAENWDKPIIVTTNVQFFESLYSNKSSKCRKLHNIVNSVIIFDEVQMLPTDYLKPCLAILEELVINYGSSIVLCTATQPTLDKYFTRIKNIKELCPRIEEQFKFFKRTKIIDVGKVSETELIDNLSNEMQVLCIVNTKKRAQRIYKELTGDGIYHLSTSMCPKHRKQRLEEIRNRLKKHERCVVISTSLVEAGVDLDFKTVYRQIAGIDSIVQASGRCNREGRNSINESIVKVFQFNDRENVPSQRQQIDITKTLLSYGYDLSDSKTIDAYFEYLYHLREDEFDKKDIMESFSSKYYEFASVGKRFKLIEENTKTIFIRYDDKAEDLLYRIKNYGFSKSLMRIASQYTVNVYENTFDKLYGLGMIKPISEDINDFYELVNEDTYQYDIGLDLNIDNGMSIFM